jgi:hypothetical protein
VEVPQPTRSVVLLFSWWKLRVSFLCVAKEKAPKERPPYDLPASRVPCASRLHWRKNKLSRFAPSNKFLLNPMKAAMLGCIEGTERRRRFKEFKV